MHIHKESSEVIYEKQKEINEEWTHLQVDRQTDRHRQIDRKTTDRLTDILTDGHWTGQTDMKDNCHYYK